MHALNVKSSEKTAECGADSDDDPILGNVVLLCIGFNLLFRFSNNIVLIHNTVKRGHSLFTFLFVYPTPT